MTREEEIEKAIEEEFEDHLFEDEYDYIMQSSKFKKGILWADENPKEGLVDIEKVEKVLGNLLFNKEEKIYRAYLDYDAFFEDFRKAMED